MELYTGYPLNKLYRSGDSVSQAFQCIREYKIKIANEPYKIVNMPNYIKPAFNGEQIILELNPDDYETMSWLSDIYNEEARIRGKRSDEQMSPYNYWQKHKAVISRNFTRIDYKRMSDEVYARIRGCNNFRPNILKMMVEYFGAKSVLDFSSGWGDRLIGAIAANARYVGVDPNAALHAGYREIIARFATDPLQYTMIEAAFEDAELPAINGATETYDLVMTSPPYFNLEVYCADETQSTSRYHGVDTWFRGFLMESILKALDVLNVGGHMILVINDAKGVRPYVERMISEINNTGAKFLGVISYADKITSGNKPYYKSPQPMWIWQKTQL